MIVICPDENITNGKQENLFWSLEANQKTLSKKRENQYPDAKPGIVSQIAIAIIVLEKLGLSLSPTTILKAVISFVLEDLDALEINPYSNQGCLYMEVNESTLLVGLVLFAKLSVKFFVKFDFVYMRGGPARRDLATRHLP